MSTLVWLTRKTEFYNFTWDGFRPQRVSNQIAVLIRIFYKNLLNHPVAIVYKKFIFSYAFMITNFQKI